jgi:hypothetical protein
VHETTADQAAVAKIALGADRAAGVGEHWPRAGPRGQDDRNGGGEVAEDRREHGGDMTDAGTGHDQAKITPIWPMADWRRGCRR